MTPQPGEVYPGRRRTPKSPLYGPGLGYPGDFRGPKSPKRGPVVLQKPHIGAGLPDFRASRAPKKDQIGPIGGPLCVETASGLWPQENNNREIRGISRRRSEKHTGGGRYDNTL